MLINLTNTGVRQPHDYKVLRLWSPAPELLIPSSYSLTSYLLAPHSARGEHAAKHRSCHFSLLSIFWIIPNSPAKGWMEMEMEIWCCQFSCCHPPQCFRFVKVQLEGHPGENVQNTKCKSFLGNFWWKRQKQRVMQSSNNNNSNLIYNAPFLTRPQRACTNKILDR